MHFVAKNLSGRNCIFEVKELASKINPETSEFKVKSGESGQSKRVSELEVELAKTLKLPTKLSCCCGAVAQLVERPSKVPARCNSTDMGSNHKMSSL